MDPLTVPIWYKPIYRARESQIISNKNKCLPIEEYVYL